jgi:hypothetical protein
MKREKFLVETVEILLFSLITVDIAIVTKTYFIKVSIGLNFLL